MIFTLPRYCTAVLAQLMLYRLLRVACDIFLERGRLDSAGPAGNRDAGQSQKQDNSTLNARLGPQCFDRRFGAHVVGELAHGGIRCCAIGLAPIARKLS
jgi:hypothetical protein